jgi:hypothetical protein
MQRRSWTREGKGRRTGHAGNCSARATQVAWALARPRAIAMIAKYFMLANECLVKRTYVVG